MPGSLVQLWPSGARIAALQARPWRFDAVLSLSQGALSARQPHVLLACITV